MSPQEPILMPFHFRSFSRQTAFCRGSSRVDMRSIRSFGTLTMGFFCRIVCVAAICMPFAALSAAERPRLAVLTDIGGDPDDQQSMVRLMVYANEFEIEALVASAAGTPGELKESITRRISFARSSMPMARCCRTCAARQGMAGGRIASRACRSPAIPSAAASTSAKATTPKARGG